MQQKFKDHNYDCPQLEECRGNPRPARPSRRERLIPSSQRNKALKKLLEGPQEWNGTWQGTIDRFNCVYTNTDGLCS